MLENDISVDKLIEKPILVGFLLGAIYWVVESAIDTLVFREGEFIEQLLPEPHAIWVRLLVWALMIAFGVYARRAIDYRRRKAQEKARLHLLLDTLRSISQLIAQENAPQRLIQGVCDRLVQIPDYHNVWIALLNEEHEVAIAVEASASPNSSAVIKYLREGHLPQCGRMLLEQEASTLSLEPRTCDHCPIAEITASRTERAFVSRVEDTGKLYGIMAVLLSSDKAIAGEISLLEEVASDIASALRKIDLKVERERAEEEHLRRTAQLEALRRVSLEIMAQLDLDALLHSIASQAVELLKCESGGLYLYNPAEDVIEWRVSAGRDRVPLGSRLHRGEGLAGRVWQEGEPLTIEAYSTWEHRAPIYDEITVDAVASVPVLWGDELLGVLNVNSHLGSQRTFSPADIELLDLFAGQAAIAIRNARLYEEAQRRAEQMAIVNRIARMIGKTLDLDNLLETVYEELEPIFRPDAFFVALYDEEAEELDYRLQIDEGRREPPIRCPLDNGITSMIVRERKPLLIRNYEKEVADLPSHQLWGTMKPPVSWLSVPMEASDRVVGVVSVQAYRPNAYGEEEELLLATIAEQVAVAIESVQLFEVASQEVIERMHAEEALREREEALQESEVRLHQQARLAAVGQLAGGIAHDFNNILTTITLYAQMALSSPSFPQEFAPSLQTILDEARGASHLIQQTLDFSRRSTIDTRPTDFVVLIEETIDILRRTLPENLRLLMEIGPEEYMVMADATRIQQMIMNLALNARDAMPDGGELSIRLARVHVVSSEQSYSESIPAGEWIRLTVSDTGTGMTPEVQEHLFEPFFTTKEPGKGTGLGLAQVYGIVKSHKGYITVETEMDQGTAFSIYLPPYESKQPAHAKQEESANIPEGNGEVILVVEDETKVRLLIEDILSSLNYRVITANNGKEALGICQETDSIDLILTDIIMPEMGGRQLVRHLKETMPELKAVAITGYAMADNIQALWEDGISQVIYKPFEIQALAYTVREALDSDRGL